MNKTTFIKELGIIQNIQKHVFEKKWPCMCPDCKNMAINSHLLQQHGLLDNLVENGHLYEIKHTPLTKCGNGTNFEFKRIGISKAISRPLFCNYHDSTLFNEIETKCVDWQDYKAQLLISYRSLCCALRKVEMCLEINQRINNANTLSKSIENNFNQSLLRDVHSLEVCKQLIENELNDLAKEFVFKTYLYPYTGIYASSAIGVYNELGAINYRFVHLLPLETGTCCIVGFQKQSSDENSVVFINSWGGLDDKTFGCKLTDLFANEIEDFGMSPSLFSRINPILKEKMHHYMTNNVLNSQEDVYFNLFEGVF